MATSLYRKQGEQFFTNAGVPLSGGYLYFYIAGTTTPQVTYNASDGSLAHANSNPIQLDSAGRLIVPIYLGSASAYKELLTDLNGVVVSPWPFDNIPAASTGATTSTFALPYLTIVTLTSSSSPYTILDTAADTLYLCNTTGGSISVYLPDASTVTAGTGFWFKKTNGNNTLTLISNGAQTIDGAASLAISPLNTVLSIISDGANWSIVQSTLLQQLSLTAQSVTASTSSLSINMNLGWIVNLTLSATVTAFTVSNWPPTGTEGRLVLHITNSSTYLISTWPSGTKWPGAAPPTITPSGIDTVLLTSDDNLTTSYGYTIAQAQA